MLPSEELRKDIAKKYNVDLEQYAWPEQLRNIIFSISLDECLEENAKTWVKFIIKDLILVTVD